MVTMIKLGLYDRLLVERGINARKIVGPGRVWLTFRSQPLAQFYIGPKSQPFTFDQVYTAEKVPMQITIQILYRVSPNLLTDRLLVSLPALNDGGWQNILQWQSEYVLRQLLADYPWQELGRRSVHRRQAVDPNDREDR